MPIRVKWDGPQPYVECAWLGDERFTEPFYDETVRRLLRDPARRMFRQVMPLDALDEFLLGVRRLQPSGFIFHWSRCGSTLLAQMLAALPRNIVISEPPPLNDLLFGNSNSPDITRTQWIRWVRSLVLALGQAHHDESHYFVKFDSWHALDAPLIMEAFPEVPWVFLYRDPAEIMVSHRRRRGSHLVPGTVDRRRLGMNSDRIERMSLDEFGAAMLAEIGTAACRYSTLNRSLFINYNEMSAAVWQRLGHFFEMSWTPDDVALMKAAAQRNSKSPWEPHVDDRADKQGAITPELRALIAAELDEVYSDLEKRRAQS